MKELGAGRANPRIIETSRWGTCCRNRIIAASSWLPVRSKLAADAVICRRDRLLEEL